MQKVIVKIPRKKQRLKVIRNRELLDEQFEGRISPFDPKPKEQSEFIEPEPEEVYLPVKKKATHYTEYFSISDSLEPVQISLKNIPPESITVNEAQIEIQRAYDKGFEDGKETSDSEYKAEIKKYEQWIRQIDSIALELKDKFLSETRQFEDIIINTANLIATQILEREVSRDSDIVIDQVRKAIATLDDDIIFRIHLNPSDVEVLEQARSILTEDKKRMENVKLIPDRSVERGGCILKSAAGSIDARIKTQIANSAQRLQNILDDHIVEGSDLRDTSRELDDSSMKISDQISSSEFETAEEQIKQSPEQNDDAINSESGEDVVT